MRIKLTCVFVDDQRAEYDRLIAAGVTFTHRPTDVGTVLMAVPRPVQQDRRRSRSPRSIR